jgi:hypothetical protein
VGRTMCDRRRTRLGWPRPVRSRAAYLSGQPWRAPRGLDSGRDSALAGPSAALRPQPPRC